MKKTLTLLLLTSSISLTYAQAQNTLTTNGMLPTDMNVFNQVSSKNSNRALKYDEIKGSPYINSSFILAKFRDNFENAPARYNTYKDEVEYTKDGETYILPKTDDFTRITFTKNTDILVMLDTKDELSGYFYELINGKYSLYKKIKTKFTDSQPAKNSYDTETPAIFKTLDPIYYIKTDRGFIKKPKNQKEIIEQIPDKKDALIIFFKENKIKFDKEEDLKKLVTFLNQN